MNAGADKVSINTAAVNQPEIVAQAADKVGSQCIVVAIDAKQTAPGRWQVFTHGGRNNTGLDAVEWAVRVANIIRDAAVTWRASPNLQLVAGQTKLPGNRQRTVSSGDLVLKSIKLSSVRCLI